jgi:ABC-type phosphate transport system substrate-binding protein
MKLVLVAALMAALVVPARAEPLQIAGSTTFTSEVMAPHQKDIEQLSGQTIILLPNRSNLGIYGLFEGNHIAMISASWADMLLEVTKQRPDLPYERLRVFNVSKTRVAFSVNRGNPVRYAELKTIGRILSGAVANWSALGGPDLPIRTVMVREGGGVRAAVEARLKITAKQPIAVQISSQVNKVVEQLPEALGLAPIENLRDSAAVELKTDQPIEQELNLLTLDDPSPAAQAVIDAVRKVVAAQGVRSRLTQ